MGKSCKNRKRVSGWHDVSSPYVLQWVFLINEDITLCYYKPYTSGININVYHSCIISDLIYILSNHVFYEKRSNSESYIVSSCHIIEVIKASKVLVTQSCPNLCDPMDCIPPGSSVHGISQARIVGSHSFLQVVFLTQGSNPSLLHSTLILYRLRHQGKPHPFCSPSIWDRYLVLLDFITLALLRIKVSCFVACPSVWVCLVFPHS